MNIYREYDFERGEGYYLFNYFIAVNIKNT